MASVFFSYSHRDEAMRDELETHLAQLKRQGIIQTSHDRRIRAGDEFENDINQYLEQADIVLLLVSPYFLDSAYCYDVEMQRALERHANGAALVIPVILQPCEWKHAPFSKLLAVPRDGRPVSEFPNQHTAFLEIATAVREAAENATKRSKLDDGVVPQEPPFIRLRKLATNGTFVRRRRVDLHLTQKEVADRGGISVRQVSEVEHGRGATERVLKRLADVLNSDWLELLAEAARNSLLTDREAPADSSDKGRNKQRPSDALSEPGQTELNDVLMVNSGHHSPSQPWLFDDKSAEKRQELQYDSLFKVRPYYVPYIKLHGSRDLGFQEYTEDHVRLDFDTVPYEVPSIIRQLACPRLDHDGDKVRVARYQIGQIADSGPTLLQTWFSPSPVKYSDFCRVAKNLDAPLPDDSSMTLRGRYAQRSSVKKSSLPVNLPNVGGVGVFVFARSRASSLQRIIITHQAPSQTFSAGVWSYSASGTMDWPSSGVPNPFSDAERETIQEIDHAIDRAKLKLIGLGMDSKELYVQFSFVEETDRFAEDILDNADDAEHEFEWDEIMSVAFTPEAVVAALLMGDWEPAAAAALITLSSKHFGKDCISDLLTDRCRSDAVG
jgi:transcriptional regulator with XRE-family HTH domain